MKKMKYVKTYESFRNVKDQKINEEFILGALKGALGKVFGAFGDAFKNITGDFKSLFKADDPNSVKGIILKQFNAAVDGAQGKLKDKDVDEAAVTGLMTEMVKSLVTVANGMDKDIVTALSKEKAPGAQSIAKAILLGSKEANWAGIIGLLDPSQGLSGITTDYKFSKTKYDALIGAAKGVDAKKAAAGKFLDDLQKDIVTQLDKEFTDEEIKKAYDDAMKKAGQGGGDYKIGDSVIYLKKDKKKEEWDKLSDDDKKKPSEGLAKDIVGIGKITKIEGDKYIIQYGAENEVADKTKEQIMAKSEAGDKVEGQDDLTNSLKDLKTKNAPAIEKMTLLAKLYADPTGNAAKIAEIEKQLGGNEA